MAIFFLLGLFFVLFAPFLNTPKSGLFPGFFQGFFRAFFGLFSGFFLIRTGVSAGQLFYMVVSSSAKSV
jgi:hypothetical protein